MKGWELLKEITEGNIKEGTKFKVFEKGELYFSNYVIYEKQTLKNDGAELTEFLTLANIAHLDFEIIEEQEEINIQDIEKLYEWVTRRNGEVTKTEGKILEIGSKVNELIQAIKQLDKQIKENK